MYYLFEVVDIFFGFVFVFILVMILVERLFVIGWFLLYCILWKWVYFGFIGFGWFFVLIILMINLFYCYKIVFYFVMFDIVFIVLLMLFVIMCVLYVVLWIKVCFWDWSGLGWEFDKRFVKMLCFVIGVFVLMWLFF